MVLGRDVSRDSVEELDSGGVDDLFSLTREVFYWHHVVVLEIPWVHWPHLVDMSSFFFQPSLVVAAEAVTLSRSCFSFKREH